jgi:hypothetical protein
LNETLGHWDSKGKEMQPFQGIGQALVLSCEAAETGHHPRAGQLHKAFLASLKSSPSIKNLSAL